MKRETNGTVVARKGALKNATDRCGTAADLGPVEPLTALVYDPDHLLPLVPDMDRMGREYRRMYA